MQNSIPDFRNFILLVSISYCRVFLIFSWYSPAAEESKNDEFVLALTVSFERTELHIHLGSMLLVTFTSDVFKDRQTGASSLDPDEMKTKHVSTLNVIKSEIEVWNDYFFTIIIIVIIILCTSYSWGLVLWSSCQITVISPDCWTGVSGISQRTL